MSIHQWREHCTALLTIEGTVRHYADILEPEAIKCMTSALPGSAGVASSLRDCAAKMAAAPGGQFWSLEHEQVNRETKDAKLH